MTTKTSSRFYQYQQNNSGGNFVYDANAGLSVHVIIEAMSAEDADRRAEEIGLYFDGVGDCACCGKRWYPQSPYNKSDSAPMIYAIPIDQYNFVTNLKWIDHGYEAFVHYMDGCVVGYGKNDTDS